MNTPASPKRPTPPKPIEHLLLPLAAAAVAVAVWHAAVRLSGTTIFPLPMQVLRGLLELLRKHVLFADIADSLRRVTLGFGAATVAAVPLGIVLGWKPAVYRVINPVVQILRPISPIAWIPLAIIFFGVGERGAVFLIFLGAFFPILVAAVDSVSSVPEIYRRAGINFGLSPAHLLWKIFLPAALPRILAGLRTALGIAWLVVVAAEMVAVDSGLGFLVIDARNSGKRYDLVVAAMLTIGLIGLLLDALLRSLEHLPNLRWGFHQQSGTR